MPRVSFILPNFRLGGAERVALVIIQALAERGIEIDLVLLRAEGELLQLLPESVRVVDLKADRFRSALVPLYRYFRREAPVSAQVFMWPLTVVATVAHKLARSKTKLVVSDHSMLSLQYQGFGRRAVAASVRMTYPWADARVVVSQAVRRDISVLSGLDPAAFDIIRNPMTLRSGTELGNKRASTQWKSRGARLLSVGTLSPLKNHALLLRAFATLEVEPAPSLVIVGEGECREPLTRLAAELGIGDRVILAGAVLDPSSFYESADLFVLPSNSEAYALVLIEALHAGVTVVSTNRGGQSEMLDGGRFGYLVPPNSVGEFASAITTALAHPLPPELLRERARQIAGPEIVQQYCAIMLPDAMDAEQA